AEAHVLDDLPEIVAAMDEGAVRVLAEEAVGEEDARNDGERQAHQPARGLEDEHDEHRAEREIERREEARAKQQVLVEDPVVDAGGEAEDAKAPEIGRASCSERV